MRAGEPAVRADPEITGERADGVSVSFIRTWARVHDLTVRGVRVLASRVNDGESATEALAERYD